MNPLVVRLIPWILSGIAVVVYGVFKNKISDIDKEDEEVRKKLLDKAKKVLEEEKTA